MTYDTAIEADGRYQTRRAAAERFQVLYEIERTAELLAHRTEKVAR